MIKLQYIADYLKEDLKAELLKQGHEATKDLLNSISVTVEQKMKGWRFVGRTLYYGKFVDRGRNPGCKKVPISELIKWIIVRKFETDKKKIRSMAFAVQYNIWKNGMQKPAKLGRITKTLDKNKTRIKVDVEAAMGELLKISIYNMVRMTNTRLK